MLHRGDERAHGHKHTHKNNNNYVDFIPRGKHITAGLKSSRVGET